MKEFAYDTTTEIRTPQRHFRAIVGSGKLPDLPDLMADEGLISNRVFIITDQNVERLYGDNVREVFGASGVEPHIMTIPSGEEHKSLQQAGDIIEQLAESKATRQDTVVAIGGGVVGDLGGFVASVYNRGVPLVHVPTTLLAMVDSSIGGKTGVDHGGKNKTGSFYQPNLVVADPDVLATLHDRVYTEGFGEIIKYAFLNGSLLPQLEADATALRTFSPNVTSQLGAIVAQCVEQKSTIIADDPFEHGDSGRVMLNYGHTLAHGLEAATGYTELLHGEAVAIGMHFAAQLGEHLGVGNSELTARQLKLLTAFGLPTTFNKLVSVDEVVDHMVKDKKNTQTSTIRFVLPAEVGRMVVKQVDVSTVHEAVSWFLNK